ncbi:MAG: biofilm regulation protein phosphatase SiaA [Desulfovermiculus sp.]
MTIFNFSLRTKSMLALVVACLVALVPTIWMGLEVLDRVREQLGEAYAQNFTLLNAQKIEAPISRELALAHRFADSSLLRQWLVDEEDQKKKTRFFQEANGYQEAFQGGNYFLVNRESLAYYYNGPDKVYSREARYVLDQENPDDEWFFTTIKDFDTFTINVNPDVHLENVQVWIDVMVWNEDQKIGMAGTGLELSAFLEEFIAAEEPGVTPMILDSQGLIQAHPDESLIAYGSGAEAEKHTSSPHKKSSLQQQFSKSSGAEKLVHAMQRAEKNPGSVETFWAGLDGTRQLVALTWIPELSWHVLSAVDLQAAQVLDGKWVATVLAALAVMFVILLLVFGYGVEKIVLRPLGTLHASAAALAHGDYDVPLHSGSRDEIGDLGRAFSAMAQEIKSHTIELEAKVTERTRELEDQSILLREAKEEAESAHQTKAEALNRVMESIHYAKTIQQAILTREEHLSAYVPDCFTLWKPKDVISGDLIWGMPLEDGFAAAVIDCTGHGVPGGLMTMAAFSSLSSIVGRIGLHNPGQVLQEVSQNVQQKLRQQDTATFAEDGLDMGLCVYQRSRRTVLFSGARLSLFYTKGKELVEIKGDRESLGYRSSNPDFPFQTHTVEVNDQATFYLTTDGLTDQVGEETGLPLGKRRWLAFLNSIREKPMLEQKQLLLAMYESFQGREEQRDDVTVLGIRVRG